MAKTSVYILLFSKSKEDLSNFIKELGVSSYSFNDDNFIELGRNNIHSPIVEEMIANCLSILKDKEELFVDLIKKYNISSTLIVDALIEYKNKDTIIPSYALSENTIHTLSKLNLTYDLNISVEEK